VSVKSALPIFLLAAFGTNLYAQGRGAPTPPKSAKEEAPIDLTGYWTSIVTQDWLYRMRTPPKGDYSGVPLNKAGKQIADAWDPPKDEAAGDQCRAYGAAGLMRIPGRLHIAWADDNTLRIDAEAGTQTRLLHFHPSDAPNSDAKWQGDSVAEWEILRTRRPPHPDDNQSPGGALKVVTTHMRAGYLRKNGVPYSEKAVMTEHFDMTTEPNGWRFILLTTVIEDPQYLTSTFLLNTPFRLLPDRVEWSPTPCAAQ
jgi:hypothetical protein